MTDRPAVELSPARRWAVLATLVLAVLLVAIDATVLTVAIPSIAADLEPTATQLLWIGDAYSFVLAGLLVIMGNAADRYGRKTVLLIGAAAFGAASVFAAFAPTAEALILARGLLGVGGATLMPTTLAIIRTVFTSEQERVAAVGIWGATASAGAALGPVLGGILLEYFWWGSVFLVNVPVMVTLLVVGALVIPESRNPDSGPLDAYSVVLSFLAIIGTVYALKEAAVFGLSPALVAVAVLALVAGVLFARRQRRLEDPLVDPSLFADAGFAASVSATFLAMFSLSYLVFYLSQYLQLIEGYSPLQAGLRELPATAAATAASLLTPLVLRHVGRNRAACAGLAMCAAALVGVLGVTGGYGILFAVLTIAGFGVGLALTVTTDTAVATAVPEKSGAAASISETGYELGVASGIAVLGSLLTWLYARSIVLPEGLSPEEATAASQSLPGMSRVADSLPAEQAEAVLAAGTDAFLSSLHVTSVVGAVVAAAGALASLLLLPRRRRGGLLPSGTAGPG